VRGVFEPLLPDTCQLHIAVILSQASTQPRIWESIREFKLTSLEYSPQAIFSRPLDHTLSKRIISIYVIFSTHITAQLNLTSDSNPPMDSQRRFSKNQETLILKQILCTHLFLDPSKIRPEMTTWEKGQPQSNIQISPPTRALRHTFQGITIHGSTGRGPGVINTRNQLFPWMKLRCSWPNL
jgi:hypothetical protein